MHRKRDALRELNQVLGHGSRFRIMFQLALNPEKTFTKYGIVKSTGLKTSTVALQLKILVDLGWVKKYPFNPETYQLDMENEIMKTFCEFLQKHSRFNDY